MIFLNLMNVLINNFIKKNKNMYIFLIVSFIIIPAAVLTYVVYKINEKLDKNPL